LKGRKLNVISVVLPLIRDNEVFYLGCQSIFIVILYDNLFKLTFQSQFETIYIVKVKINKLTMKRNVCKFTSILALNEGKKYGSDILCSNL
jgi:hypothetical protein